MGRTAQDEKSFQIVPLEYKRDIHEVSQVLIDFYKREWPLIYLLPEVPKDIDKLLQNRIEYYLKRGPELSFGIREVSSGKLLGALVSCVVRRETFVAESEEGYSDGIKQIIRLQKQVEGDLFALLNTDAIAKMGVGAVDPMYGRKGLMVRLGEAFEKAAYASGVEYSVSMGVSEYSRRSLDAKKDKIMNTIEYSQYCDPITGEKPFTRPFPPHTHVSEYYRKMHGDREL